MEVDIDLTIWAKDHFAEERTKEYVEEGPLPFNVDAGRSGRDAKHIDRSRIESMTTLMRTCRATSIIMMEELLELPVLRVPVVLLLGCSGCSCGRDPIEILVIGGSPPSSWPLVTGSRGLAVLVGACDCSPLLVGPPSASLELTGNYAAIDDR